MSAGRSKDRRGRESGEGGARKRTRSFFEMGMIAVFNVIEPEEGLLVGKRMDYAGDLKRVGEFRGLDICYQ